MTRDDDDRVDAFERMPKSKHHHGNGSAHAANKGKVKRRLKYARWTGKRKYR